MERILLVDGPLHGEWRTVVLGSPAYETDAWPDLEAQLAASIKLQERGLAAVPEPTKLRYERMRPGGNVFQYKENE